MLRCSIVSSSELASYDQAKEMLLRSGLMKDGVPCHIVASCIAGATAAFFGSPVEVIKTRIMSSSDAYAGPIDCAIKTFRNEGFTAFYKGFFPYAMR